jgi:branched-chain amino acid transport system substrate-binding protein
MGPLNIMKTGLAAGALAIGLIAMPVQPAKAQSDTYKIGLVSSLTGPGAFLGDPFSRAAKMAVERANAAGGINGKKIDLIVYDTEASADKTLVFVKKLISEDKVSAILGPDFSGTVRAVLPIIEEAGIPTLYNTPVIEPKAGSFHFTPWPSEETSYRVALTSLKGRNVKKLAVLATTDVTGESGLKAISGLAAEYGVTIGPVERMELQDKDVTAQLTNIKGAKPDGMFFIGSGAAVAVVAKSYTRLGMTQPMGIGTGAVSATFPELLKGITPDTLIFPTYKMIVVDSLPDSDPNKKPILDFMKDYEAKQGKKADFYAGAGWDLANITIEAMKKAGTDPKKIRNAIQQIRNYPATMAVLSFAPENHRGAGPDAQVMGQFKDGKFMAAK